MSVPWHNSKIRLRLYKSTIKALLFIAENTINFLSMLTAAKDKKSGLFPEKKNYY